jgi:hypothetical protein
MYVIVHKNHVIDGPKKWSFRSFEETLREDLNITCRLPTNYTSKEAIVIDENTKIMFATFINQEFNGKIQKPVDGPWWDFSTGLAVGSYTIGYKHIDEVKTELKNRLKQLRYEKEIAGTDVELNGQTFRIDTSRDARNIYLQKYFLCHKRIL